MKPLKQDNTTQSYKLIKVLSEAQLRNLHDLYENEWWSTNRTLKDTKNIVSNSSVIFGIVDQNDSLIAFCRVLTDYCVFVRCAQMGFGDSYVSVSLRFSIMLILFVQSAEKSI